MWSGVWCASWLVLETTIDESNGPTNQVPVSSFKSTEDQQQSAERAAGHDRGLSLDGALQAARGVRRVATGIRGRELRRSNPAFRKCAVRPLGANVDLVEEPEVLLCPITRTVFRNPVVLFESGHTYERAPFVALWCNGAKDPLTRRALSSTKVMPNWAVRKFVQAWLDSTRT